jgi:HAD superfamily phosphatase (TIGR01668 family)
MAFIHSPPGPKDHGQVCAKRSRVLLGPDRFAPRLSDVSLDDLESEGVRGLIIDLDNTLMGFGQTQLCEDHLAWVARAHERGFPMVMVSNNFTDRVTSVARELNVPCVPNALKPLPFGVMRAIRILGIPRAQVALVGDQLFTDVLAGKLCGIFTILTEPIEPKDFPLTRVFRFFERLMLPDRPS